MKNQPLLAPALILFLGLMGQARAAVLLDDTWSDGTRTDTTLPTDAAWWSSTTAVGAGALTATTGSMSGSVPADGAVLWINYFTTNDASPVSLVNIGDTLTLTLKFSLTGLGTNNASSGFRVAVANTSDSGAVNAPGTARVDSDASFTSGSLGVGVQGYALFQNMCSNFSSTSPMLLRLRTNFTSASLLGTTADWQLLGSGPGSTNSFPGFANGITYSLQLTLRKLGLHSLSFRAGWSNHATGATLSTAVTNNNANNFNFDTLALRPQTGDSTATNFTFTNFKGEFVSGAPGNHPPIAVTDVISCPQGLAFQILKSSLLTNDTDADNDALTVAGIDLMTTNGYLLTTNAAYIFYTNFYNEDDSFTYTVSDPFGAAASGRVLTLMCTNIGETQTVTVTGATATLSFDAIPGFVYEVQRSTNLTVWVPLATNLVPVNGVFEVVVNFEDLGGPPAKAFYRLRYLSPRAAPFITQQPQSQSIGGGDAAAFRVVANGFPPLQYHWYFNSTLLPGKTAAILSITNAQPTDAGNYFVVVSNAYGAVTSSVAALAVLTYYVATNGSDSNSGTNSAQPFATLAKAMSLAAPGNLIYVRGGTYSNATYLRLTASGTAAEPIRVFAYPGEQPVLDFSAESFGVKGLEISGSWCWVRGLEVQGAGAGGINVTGHSNLIERCVAHHNRGTGISASQPGSHNLILNCDSYRNYDYDPDTNLCTHGENADGFGAKFGAGPGNVFRGCRSWENSDDGWDLWMATNTVVVEDCWTWRNGTNFLNDPLFTGNGQGFKMGGYYQPGAHFFRHCVSFGNPHNGFDQNNNTAGQTLDHCTSWGNGDRNFRVSGTNAIPHVLRNNLSIDGRLTDAFTSGSRLTNNSWQIITSPVVDTNDVLSVDTSLAEAARNSDGSLPTNAFLRPVPAGRLVDQGVDLGEPYHGAAPDLGAFETP